jgi:hypothetical protein
LLGRKTGYGEICLAGRPDMETFARMEDLIWIQPDMETFARLEDLLWRQPDMETFAMLEDLKIARGLRPLLVW